jgi:hypothetical protein
MPNLQSRGYPAFKHAYLGREGDLNGFVGLASRD